MKILTIKQLMQLIKDNPKGVVFTELESDELLVSIGEEVGATNVKLENGEESTYDYSPEADGDGLFEVFDDDDIDKMIEILNRGRGVDLSGYESKKVIYNQDGTPVIILGVDYAKEGEG